MRLSNYLTEGRSNKIEMNDAIGFIKENAMDSVHNKSVIYRGIQETNDVFLYVDPSKHTRQSANTYNYYTLLMDNLPQWKNYPKRSKSIICSSDKKTSYDYGTLYRVFPFDTAKIGVCPSEDIWVSFEPDIENLATLNEELYYIAKALELEDRLLSVDTYSEFMWVCNEIDRLKKYIQVDEIQITTLVLYDYISEFDAKLLPMLEKALDPKKHYFELETPKSISLYGSDKEIWTDSKSILIRNDMVDGIIKDYFM